MLRAGRYSGADALWRHPGTDGRSEGVPSQAFRQAVFPRSLALASPVIKRVCFPRRRSTLKRYLISQEITMSFLERARQWFENIVHHDDYAEVTVHKGDTLWAIVKDVTGADSNTEIQRHIDEVKALNPGMDVDMIHPGQHIRVPLDWA